MDTDERSTLILVLCTQRAHELFGTGWKEQAKRMVAQFRATHDLWAGDPAFVDLIARLRRDNREFQTWWAAHEVRGATDGRKLLQHPKKGALHLQYTSFQASDDPALKLTIYYTQV